ncbi:MAG: putative inorganic polyphosphate/ATP-NAD kinase, partial [Verrucomicrobiota bacterium]
MDQKVVGVIANAAKPGVAGVLAGVVEVLRGSGMEVWMDEGTAQLGGESCGVPVGELAGRCDWMVVLGGDGTLLQMVHRAGVALPPVLGVNAGTLGFLTGVTPARFGEVWAQVVRGEAMVSERSLLLVEVVRDGETFWRDYSLNEVVLSRGERSRLIRLHVEIDGVSLTEYNADGLIVATPTGSTAYSLSAGGPLISPDSGVFVITPICPHVLTNRSVIISDRSLITVCSTSLQHGVCLTSDGQDPLLMEPGDVFR